MYTPCTSMLFAIVNIMRRICAGFLFVCLFIVVIASIFFTFHSDSDSESLFDFF